MAGCPAHGQPNSPSAPSPKSTSEDALLEAWFPLYDAHVLASIATEIEDDELYAKRARVVVRVLQERIDRAYRLIEKLLDPNAYRRARSA